MYVLIITDDRESGLPVDTYWYRTAKAADFLAKELVENCPHLDVWCYWQAEDEVNNG